MRSHYVSSGCTAFDHAQGVSGFNVFGLFTLSSRSSEEKMKSMVYAVANTEQQ